LAKKTGGKNTLQSPILRVRFATKKEPTPKKGSGGLRSGKRKKRKRFRRTRGSPMCGEEGKRSKN